MSQIFHFILALVVVALLALLVSKDRKKFVYASLFSYW